MDVEQEDIPAIINDSMVFTSHLASSFYLKVLLMKLIYGTIPLLSSLVSLMAMEQPEQKELDNTLLVYIQTARLDYKHEIAQYLLREDEYYLARVSSSLHAHDHIKEGRSEGQQEAHYASWLTTAHDRLIHQEQMMAQTLASWHKKIQELAWNIYGPGCVVTWHEVMKNPTIHVYKPISQEYERPSLELPKEDTREFKKPLKPMAQDKPVEKRYKLRNRSNLPAGFYRQIQDGARL